MTPVTKFYPPKSGNAFIQNFSANELVIEIGRDIFARVEQKLVLTFFAGSSIQSEIIGNVIPSKSVIISFYTSAGTIRLSRRFSKADTRVYEVKTLNKKNKPVVKNMNAMCRVRHLKPSFKR